MTKPGSPDPVQPGPGQPPPDQAHPDQPRTAAELLAIYDARLRTRAEVADVDEVHTVGPLWVATIPGRGRGFVTHAPLSDDADPAELVRRVQRHFRADPRVRRVEWKLRDHDRTPGLVPALLAHGYRLEEPETVMVGDARVVLAADAGLPPGYRLARADSPALLREAEALAGVVFGDDPSDSHRLADELVRRAGQEPGAFEMWLVRAPDGRVACSGRLELAADELVAGLWGGACHPSHRGLGLYRVLTAQRARVALARGRTMLYSDCTEMSRPVLERAGLVAVTTTTPALWWRGDDTSPSGEEAVADGTSICCEPDAGGS